MYKKTEDIIIVGAGLTGLAFCSLLKDTKIKLSLLDTQPKKIYKSFENERHIVLSNSSKSILESIGLWKEINKYCSKVKNIHISKKNIFGSSVVKSADENLESLGYQVPVKILMNILYSNIENENNINIIHGAQVMSVDKGKEINVNYKLESIEKNLVSRSLVFSSGSKDKILNNIFSEIIQKDYKQNAIVCELLSNKYNSDTAYERFTNNGVLGVIPRKENIWTLIYSTNEKESEIIENLENNELKKYFQNLMGKKCGKISEINNVKIYPLKMRYYKNFTNKNICLLGDAAHTLHPIAAQSFNLSLRDCAYLTKMIKKNEKEEINNFSRIFDCYHKERIGELERLVKFTDFLASFIHGGGFLKNSLISASLLFMDINKSLRINIIRYLLGINFSQALISNLKKQ
ncbi:FAD-dependent monooxygenase [Gammaproteobacteria bacterium]|nr:FAD-dependent monooxygenase [Gammaproteobacteria bacterium]